MRRVWSFSTVLLGAVVASSQGQAPNLALSPKPLTVIGVVDGPVEQELVNVTGARRLSDGRVLVANGKPLELRLYDASGKFVGRVGRKGGGPGEFETLPTLLPTHGDSILAYDRGNGRLTYYLASGKVLRETKIEEPGHFDGAVVLYHRAMVHSLKLSESGCVKQLLDRLPPPPPPTIRQVHSDGAGHFWVSADQGPAWTVYASNGTVIGTVMLPPKFALYQVGDGFATGKRLLEDDIEQVQVLGVKFPSARTPPCTARPDSFPDVKNERTTVLRKGLIDAMTSGEMYYSDHAKYPTLLDSMPGLKAKLPPQATLVGFLATQTGWGAVIFDRQSTLTCAFALASAAMPGWKDGGIFCRE